jgi:ribosomal-protein-alanine N-acetyltransferase
MQQTFKLRKFKADDLQSVMYINRFCLPENYMDFFFMDLHQRCPETFIVAEQDGKIVGYIMCRIEVGLASLGLGGLIRKGHVVSIAVLPQGRRKGVAQALLAEAMKGMRHYSAKLCYLEVRVTNTPLALQEARVRGKPNTERILLRRRRCLHDDQKTVN